MSISLVALIARETVVFRESTSCSNASSHCETELISAKDIVYRVFVILGFLIFLF